jgi:hypothetical protein
MYLVPNPVIPSQGMAGNRDLPGRRWLSISLRSLHLIGVVLAGVGLVGNGTHSATGAALMLLTGLGLFGVDLWHYPDLWREVAGAFVFVKLLVVVAMLLAPGIAGLLFWLLLVSSSVVSHAPRAFRHRRILG